ncbi:hypothetical protein GT352_28100 [Streptomyces sp. SID1046]|uniref:hypothetical protein n=1 Tax=Streptomyces sp. SID1046 TaxID=2690249 RepID=UPI001369E2C7|nr:hypothetical protein [Streptomyces sp. SID1046]MYV77764.1 hypothetical protein [Streptomyces sp. SID1046]
MPDQLIAAYLKALRVNDTLTLARVEAQAAEYDAHNRFGVRLVDELTELAADDMPMAA